MNNLFIKVSAVYAIRENLYVIQSDVEIDGAQKHFLYSLKLGNSEASYITDGLYQNLEVTRRVDTHPEI